MKWAAILVVGLALGGCQKTVSEMTYSEKLALANEIANRCAAQGFGDGHKLQRDCIVSEANREIYTRQRSVKSRQNAGMAIAAASQSYGNAMQQGYNRPLNCTSTPFRGNIGGPVSSVNTTCY